MYTKYYIADIYSFATIDVSKVLNKLSLRRTISYMHGIY